MPFKIIVICTGNSIRSQIAHGFFEYFLKNNAEIFSAGTNPCFVHPNAIKVMAELGIDISKHTSDNINKYSSIHFDFIITVCDYAKLVCPYLPGTGIRIHHGFEDPSILRNSDKDVLSNFRRVRDEIKNYCLNFIKENNLTLPN